MAKAAGGEPSDGAACVGSSRTFKLSNDRRFDEKLIEVVGVYLN
jgi:hypothetical protein